MNIRSKFGRLHNALEWIQRPKAGHLDRALTRSAPDPPARCRACRPVSRTPAQRRNRCVEQKRRDGQQRTSCKQLGDWRLVSNPAALLAKVLDQLKEMLVFRNDEGQLFGVFERGVNILGFAVER